MTQYAHYKRFEGETPSLGEHIKNLHFAFDQPESKRFDAMEYAILDVIANFCRDFLRSQDSVNSTRLMFQSQVDTFRKLMTKFVYYVTDEGDNVPFMPPNSYESLISVLSDEDARLERETGKSTKRFVNGKLREVEPHKMMRDAGYDIDEGLGLDIREALEDLGFIEIVEKPYIPKKVVAKEVLMGLGMTKAPRSILLDGPEKYKPNITIGGMF